MQIRRLFEHQDLVVASLLEATVWGASDPIPPSLLSVFVHHGGLMLGAYSRDQLIGIALAFPARDGERVTYLHSHLLGVLPGFRGQGVGESLKRAQRDWAQDEGFPYVGWTYDPLVAANAWFNLSVLGASVASLKTNAYGRLTDALNRDRPTHRFWVEWSLNPKTSAQTEGPVRMMLIPDDFQAMASSRPQYARDLSDQWFETAQSWWQDGWRIRGVERMLDGVAYRWVARDGEGVKPKGDELF